MPSPAATKSAWWGRNGTGKTTLFRLIRGELTPDAGQINMARGARIGGVSQEAPSSDMSLLETVLAADTERAALMTEARTATAPARIAAIQTPACRHRCLGRRGAGGHDPARAGV